MQQNPSEKILTEIGLSRDQSSLYLYLLRNGSIPASILAKRVGISRTLVYKVLQDLERLGLVEKDFAYKVTRFSAKHPYVLRKFADLQRQAAEELAQKIERGLLSLVSEFNTQSKRPSIHVMEGLSGAEQALDDTLTATEEIYGYLDNDAVASEVQDIGAAYNKKRLKKGIFKKTLMPDTSSARMYVQNLQDTLSQIRLLPTPANENFHSVLNLYDGKVSYISFKNGTFISTIIQDSEMYAMQRFLFESQWRSAIDLQAQGWSTGCLVLYAFW